MKRPSVTQDQVNRIGGILRRDFDANPRYRARIEALAAAGEVEVPEGTLERIWRERIQPELAKEAAS
jgi:hypothetical protein